MTLFAQRMSERAGMQPQRPRLPNLFETRQVSSRPPRRRAVAIAGVQFDNLSRGEVLEWIEQAIRQNEARMICTANADHVVRARRDVEFRSILERADLVVADGMAVVYAARFLGTPLKQNIVGRYLLPLLATCSAVKGYRLFVVGGSSADVASQTVERLRSEYPGVAIVGCYTPPFVRNLEEDEGEVTRIVEAVNAAHADVLFVCLGTPKQEKLIANALHRLNVKVAVGIGAALEILSGRIHEPPRWATEVGVEWAFRLLQEPRRLARRYLWDDPRLFLWVLRQRMKGSTPS